MQMTPRHAPTTPRPSPKSSHLSKGQLKLRILSTQTASKNTAIYQPNDYHWQISITGPIQ